MNSFTFFQHFEIRIISREAINDVSITNDIPFNFELYVKFYEIYNFVRIGPQKTVLTPIFLNKNIF